MNSILESKKGAVTKGGISTLIIGFMGVIVALAIFQGLTDPIANMREEVSAENITFTAAATLGGFTAIEGRELTDTVTVVIWNATFSEYPSTGNFSVAHSLDSNADLSIRVNVTAEGWQAGVYNITYSYRPDGYDNSSAGRSIIAIVLIFAALGIAAFLFKGVKEAFD